jgi:DNA-binding NarL/FixJ family response regulator
VMLTKILLADDSPTIRRSLRTLLSEETAWTICGEAEDGKMAVEMAQRLSPDLVILDLSMPEMNGLDAARQIKGNSPDTRILLLTMHAHPQLSAEARRFGINEVIAKSDSPRLLNTLHSLLGAPPS